MQCAVFSTLKKALAASAEEKTNSNSNVDLAIQVM